MPPVPPGIAVPGFATVVAYLGAIGLGTVVGLTIRLLRWGRRERFLRLRFGGPVDVIITTTAESEAPAGPVTFDQWQASHGTIQALASVSAGMGSMWNRKTVRVHMSRGVRSSELDDELVLLGGNNRNSYTNRFLRYLRLNCPAAGLEYNDRDEALNVMGLGGAQWTYRWREECRERPNGPVRDLALIVLWINPFAETRRRAILCAGFTSIGTSGAARRIFASFAAEAAPRLRRSLPGRLVRGRWPCCAAIYELEIDGDTVTSWTLLGFRALDGPQHPRDLRAPTALDVVRRNGSALDAAAAASVSRLLVSAFGEGELAGPGASWTQAEPVFRVLALDGAEIVGHVGVARIARSPGVTGISDLVVRADHRGLGLGRRLVEEAFRQAESESDVVMIATDAPPVLRVVGELGFERSDGRFFYVSDGERRRNEHWLYTAVPADRALPDSIEISSDF